MSKVDVGSAFWRRLAYAGARHGPRAWVRFSPGLFGLVFACALPERRRHIRDNLRCIHGRRAAWLEHVDVARTFVEFSHCLAESLGSERTEARGAVRRIDGRHHFDAALAVGRGALIVTAHAGVWDVAAQLLGRAHDVPVMVVMQPEADARARALHDAVRFRRGISVAHVGTDPLAALPVLGHLRKGGVVAIQLDRHHPGGENLETSLFGQRFLVPRGPFVLSALTGAPVLPVFCRRHGYFDYSVTVARPIRLARRATAEQFEQAAAECVAGLEDFVRAHPTQWFHFAGLGAKSHPA